MSTTLPSILMSFSSTKMYIMFAFVQTQVLGLKIPIDTYYSVGRKTDLELQIRGCSPMACIGGFRHDKFRSTP